MQIPSYPASSAVRHLDYLIYSVRQHVRHSQLGQLADDEEDDRDHDADANAQLVGGP